MSQIQKLRRTKSWKLKVVDVVNHGNHEGIGNGISTREIAIELGCERTKVINQMYPVTRYFLAQGRVLLTHKAKRMNQIYFFADGTEARVTGIQSIQKRVSAILRMYGLKLTALHHEDPQLEFNFGPQRIADGVILSIEEPKKKETPEK